MPAQFPVTDVEIKDNVSPTLATSAKQDTANTALAAILAAVDQLEGYLDTVETKLQSLVTGPLVVEPGPGAEFALADTTFAVDSLPLPTGAASESKLEAVRALLAGTLQAELPADATFSVDSLPLPDGAATQTTLAAVLAKLIAAPSTEAKQDTANTALAAILAAVDGLEGSTDGLETALSTLNGKDFATQTTLAAILAAVDGLEGYLDGVEGKLDAVIAPLAGDGRKTVTTAGTALALATSTACKWVSVQPLSTNTDKVAVGTSTVLAASGSGRGVVLSPGDPPVFIPAANLANVYVDSRVNGEGVAYAWGA